MSTEHSFVDLKERLISGDPTAGEEIFRRYAQQLIRVVSPRVAGSLRQKVDPEDIVQSAFRSFFRAGPAEAFETQGWNDLWAVLVTITLRKCRYQVRQFLTAKRNINKEIGVGTEESGADWRFVASEPTPAEATELTDLVQHFLSSLDDRNRVIAEMAMADATPAEIGKHLGLTERTIYRQLERIRDQLEAMDT